MMKPNSEQSYAAENDEIRLIEAGPGSGKTFTLLERFKRQSKNTSRGIAFISYTNAAVDEVKGRCHGSPGLLSFPNYIGTFDSFIDSFLITPYFCRTKRSQKPTFFSDWSEVTAQTERVGGVLGIGISPQAFHKTSSGTVFNEQTASTSDKSYWTKLTEKQKSQLEWRVNQKITRQIDKGIFIADNARHYAYTVLCNNDSTILEIVQEVSLRFKELIVDEFQDFSNQDMEIIKFFEDNGIHVTVAADPDQGIYEFRGASANAYLEYKKQIPETARCELLQNHRSTIPICAAINAFRVVGSTVTSTSSKTDEAPVYVIQGKDQATRDFFIKLLAKQKILVHDSRVLAYRKSIAAKLAGQRRLNISSKSRIYTILESVGILLKSKYPSERQKAINKCRPAVLELIDFPNELPQETIKAKTEAIGLTDSLIGLVLLRIAANVPSMQNLQEVTECIQSTILDTLQHELKTLKFKSPKKVYPKPKKDFWNKWKEQVHSSSPLIGASVHSVKGQEFDAVLLDLCISEDTLTQLCQSPSSVESTDELKVFYVGLSRAKKLLVVHCKNKNDESLLKTILSKENVPAEYKELK